VGAGLGDGSHLKIDIVLSSADCRFGLAADLVPVALVARTLSRREEKQILLPQGGIRMTCPAAAGAKRRICFWLLRPMAAL
jgi:hypothetical protein